MPKGVTDSQYTKRKWIMWAICVLFVFYKYVIEVYPSVITKKLMLDLKIDAAWFGSLAASYYYSYTLFQIPAGLLIDRFGIRKMTTAAIILCSLGTYFFSLSQGIVTASTSRFLMGLGGTFAVLTTLKLTANWFPSSLFALLTGLMLTLGTLGAVFGQAPLGLYMHAIGWREGLFDVALFGLVLAGVFFFIVRDRPQTMDQISNERAEKKIPLGHALLNALKHKQTWVLSIYSGLSFAPIMAFGGLWGVSFLETKYNHTTATAGFLSSLIFIGFALGAPLWGWLSTRLGKRKPVMFWGSLFSFFILISVVYAPIHSFGLLGTSLFLFGFFLSAFLLSFTMIHESNIPMLTASAIGIMNTLNGLFGAITDPLIGFILDLGLGRKGFNIDVFTSKDFEIALSFLPAYLIICLGLLFFLKETYCKQREERKT